MTDPWIRFDLWADRAHEASQAAIAAEAGRGFESETCALADVNNRAADVYRDLAVACRPDEDANARSSAEADAIIESIESGR